MTMPYKPWLNAVCFGRIDGAVCIHVHCKKMNYCRSSACRRHTDPLRGRSYPASRNAAKGQCKHRSCQFHSVSLHVMRKKCRLILAPGNNTCFAPHGYAFRVISCLLVLRLYIF